MNSTESNDAPEFSSAATYCPEDNKLRLYVGRVPREEYLKLRAEGWQALHKQRESGGGDFAAVWTPERRDTALAYAGYIGDEDQGPAERAADRAERFSGYRDKREGEAIGHADKFDAGPQAHGYQSAARAERASARHDRIAGRAVDLWGKAEYWTQRTAGVISHALYVSAPGVRMGRIKTIEADLRRFQAIEARHSSRDAMHTRDRAWLEHYENRLAYENQMLAAQGGRLAEVEMIPGGFLGGKQIHKVSKSPATGRVTSVKVKVPRVEGWTYQIENVPCTDYALFYIETERLAPGAYRAPTAEELAAFNAERKAEKAARPVKDACPLVNPTPEEAKRLQDLWNAAARERGERRKVTHPYGYNPELTEPLSEVLETTQANYSAGSGGTYSVAQTIGISAGGVPILTYDQRKDLKPVCKVRVTSGGSYMPRRVIVLTDKPQKAFPAAVWQVVAAGVEA